MASLEEKLEDAERKRGGAKACLQQMQSGQQKLQSAVSRVQNEISVLVDVVENDRDYCLKRQDEISNRMFVVSRKLLSEKEMEFKNTMFEETK